MTNPMTPAQFQAIKERLEARIADFKHRVGMALSHNPTYPIMLRPEHLRDLYTNLAACVAEIERLQEQLASAYELYHMKYAGKCSKPLKEMKCDGEGAA